MRINLSLRLKLLFLTLSVVICFGGTIGFYLVTRVADDLTGELLKRGTSIARHIAELSAESFIENDVSQLHYLARSHQSAEADIRYILMINRAGELLGHSFGATFPPDLTAANRYVAGQEAVIKQLDTGHEIVYDIAVPVLDGRVGGVRIGMSAESIRSVVDELINEILLAVLLFGALAFAVTLPVAQAIARPLSRLTRAIRGVSSGRRDLQLPADRSDEIGQLNDAFNQMAEDVRKAEKRLAAQVSFLQVLMEDLPVPVFYKDAAGRMLGCNRAFADFWGKPVDAIIGRAAEELYPPEDSRLHRAKDAEVLRDEKHLAYEHVVAGADRKHHDIIFHKAPFRDEDGRVAGIIGAMQDVTLQRDASRMKSEFISTVAHEFQTPLATIIGFGELLRDDALEGGGRDDAVKMIIRKSEMLSQMVDELLDMARLEGGRPLIIEAQSCEVGQLLEEIVSGFRRRVATHRFLVDSPPDPLVVQADPKRLTQVVENLLSNAVKYSGEGSSVEVRAAVEGDRCRIAISDSGVGMSPQQLEHLFEKFYRANSSGSAPTGTGLGLFIARSIIEAHHGEIRIESSLGRGTTVTVLLPMPAGGETSPVGEAGTS